MTMIRVLILQNEISSYNVSTYNEVSKHYNLTVGYFSDDKSKVECRFAKKKFKMRQFGPLTYVLGVRDYCKNFEVVCFIPNLRIPSYCILPFLPHNYKLISWSIGFRVSYTHPYILDRKHCYLDNLFKYVLSKCDANIFYMNKAKDFWRKTNLRMDNVFEAINTTDVERINFLPNAKRDFVFIGTLYRGKGLDFLLRAFNAVVSIDKTDVKLHIVGTGTELNSLIEYVENNNLSEKVIFHGAIYEEKEIAKIFQKSILCISPTQAGLSVPKSMGYGVPFATRKDAITGGELYHITNHINGIIYDKDCDLSDIMKDTLLNRTKYIDMGKNAMDYYYGHATVRHKVNGVLSAINHVI